MENSISLVGFILWNGLFILARRIPSASLFSSLTSPFNAPGCVDACISIAVIHHLTTATIETVELAWNWTLLTSRARWTKLDLFETAKSKQRQEKTAKCRMNRLYSFNKALDVISNDSDSSFTHIMHEIWWGFHQELTARTLSRRIKQPIRKHLNLQWMYVDEVWHMDRRLHVDICG